jgi:hypothetical protein
MDIRYDFGFDIETTKETTRPNIQVTNPTLAIIALNNKFGRRGAAP